MWWLELKSCGLVPAVGYENGFLVAWTQKETVPDCFKLGWRFSKERADFMVSIKPSTH